MKIFQYIYKVSACVLLSAGLLTACSDDTLLSSQDNKVNPAASEGEFPWQPGSAFFQLKESQSITTRAASECVTRAKVFDNDKVKVEQVFDMTTEYADLKRRMGLDRWFIVRFDEKTDVNEVLKELRNDPAIEKAHGNLTVVPAKVTYTPATRAPLSQYQLQEANDGRGPRSFTDPYLKYQWHYTTTFEAYNLFKPEAGINLFPAWQQETGDPNVVVAVLDSGIDFGHPDLAASAWDGGKDPTTGQTIHGRNFYYVSTGQGNVNEIIPGGHGTHVAGTIAARNNNYIGVSGVAGGDGTDNSGVRLMSCEIYGRDGYSETADVHSIVKAFEFAQEKGALIANCSWGYQFDRKTYFNNDYFQERFKDIFALLKGGIDYFTAYAGCDKDGKKKAGSYMKGGLVFFASGNDGQNDIDMIPGSYDKVVAVGAVDGYNRATDYMDKGYWVDILAPGGTLDPSVTGGILSTVPNDYQYQKTGDTYNTDYTFPGDYQYAYAQGTSMAAPHVTGVAALVISKFGKKDNNFTNEKLRERILTSIKSIDPYKIRNEENLAGKLGAGIIDASLALADPETQKPEKPTVTAATHAAEDLKGYYDEQIEWNVTGDPDAINTEKTAFAYDIELFEKSNMKEAILKKTVYTYQRTVGEQMTYDFQGLKSNVEYEVHVVARDRFNNKSEQAVSTFKTRMNHEPKLTKTIGDKLVLLDTQPYYHAVLPVVDEDKHTWTYTTTALPSGVELKRVGDSFDLLIKVGQPGSYSFDVTMTDQLGGKSVEHFNYEVVAHTAPKAVAPLKEVSLTEGGEAAVVDLAAVFQTGENSNIVYSAKSDDEGIVKATVDGNQLKLTPGKAGFATISLTVGDGVKHSVTTFQVRVSSKGSSDVYAVYPVPAHSFIKVLMHSDVTEVQAVVTSVLGHKLIDEKLTVNPSTHEVILGVDRLVPGTYYLLMKTGRVTSKHTFIKK